VFLPQLVGEPAKLEHPDRDPLWFELYDRKPRIEKSVLYLDNTPGFGVEFNQNTLRQYGTKVL
jgi:L-alanine-DL-glutamate epimerase-like enolase superfamily enzyme